MDNFMRLPCGIHALNGFLVKKLLRSDHSFAGYLASDGHIADFNFVIDSKSGAVPETFLPKGASFLRPSLEPMGIQDQLLLELKDKVGLYDLEKGLWTIAPIYKYLSFADSKTLIYCSSENEKYGLIDIQGKVLSTAVYPELTIENYPAEYVTAQRYSKDFFYLHVSTLKDLREHID